MINALILLAALSAQPAATTDLPCGLPTNAEVCTEQEATKIRGRKFPVNTGGGAIPIRCASFDVQFRTQTFRGHDCHGVQPDTRRF